MLSVRLCEAQHSETAAGLRGVHGDGGHVDLGATGFLVKQN